MNYNDLTFKEKLALTGLSVTEFANRLSVTPATIYNWMRGGVIPSSKIGPIERIFNENSNILKESNYYKADKLTEPETKSTPEPHTKYGAPVDNSLSGLADVIREQSKNTANLIEVVKEQSKQHSDLISIINKLTDK